MSRGYALGLLILSGLLVGCVTPSATEPTAAIAKAENAIANSPQAKAQGCAELRSAVTVPALSFAALHEGPLGETWNFALFPQRGQNDTEPFAWLCGTFWLPVAAAEPANGTLDVLLSPRAYHALQAAFTVADFFTLPAHLSPDDATVPRFIITAADASGQRHRVTLSASADLLDTPEQMRFEQLWKALNALLPARLVIELVPQT